MLVDLISGTWQKQSFWGSSGRDELLHEMRFKMERLVKVTVFIVDKSETNTNIGKKTKPVYSFCHGYYG